jgi:GNAT superfamily N-acetyltransferase
MKASSTGVGEFFVYTIRRGTPADLKSVTALIVDAFADLPVSRWLVPPAADRAAVLEGNFAIHAEHALAHGIVEIAGDERDDVAGVAVWLPRPDPGPPPADLEVRLEAACGPYTPRFRELDEAFAANHPHGDERHHHLTFLAAAPARQGQGVGTALLAHHHKQLDDAGLPAYLEASSERARELYTREGYRAEKPFHLPDGGPPLWPMWRLPA